MKNLTKVKNGTSLLFGTCLVTTLPITFQDGKIRFLRGWKDGVTLLHNLWMKKWVHGEGGGGRGNNFASKAVCRKIRE